MTSTAPSSVAQLVNTYAKEVQESANLRRLCDALMRVYKLDRNCTRCDNFDQRDELCKVWKARPPARVIVSGCEKFDEGVPF